MRKEFNGQSGKSGIYKITNVITNDFYIGSAKCFQKRAAQHQNRLNTRKHCNKHLLNSWNKYGETNFLFEVVEVIDGPTEKRRKREQEYLTKIFKDGSWNKCYNSKKTVILKDNYKLVSKARKGKTYEEIYGAKRAKKVRERISNSHKGKFLSEEHKESIRKNAKENPNYGLKNKKHTKKTKQKISQSRIGEKHWFYGKKLSKSHCEKLYKEYKNINLVSPCGETITQIFGITKFCKKHNLSAFALKAVIEGKALSHKGWKLKSTDLEKYIEKRKKELRKRFSGKNNPFYGKKHTKEAKQKISSFQKGKSLEERLGKEKAKKVKMALELANQERMKNPNERQRLGNHIRGKSLEEIYGNKKAEEIKEKRSKAIAKTYEGFCLVAPNGKKYYRITNMLQFCKKHNLCDAHLRNLIKGNLNAHKGWKIQKN